MLRLYNVVMIFIILNYILMFIFLHSSLYFWFDLNFFYFSVSLQYNFLWFIFFIFLMLFFFVYLLTKKVISYIKYCLLIFLYVLIGCVVSLLSIIDDLILFMIFFESLFFPLCFISLFFNFNNRFVFAIYFLIVFSSLSSVLCMIVCIVIILHFNVLNLVNFVDICYFDSLYLNIFLWLTLFIMFGIKYPIWPLHIWLPEVHVEVTTEMSALLASVVLKIGFFGMYKFIFLVFNQISIWFLGFIDSILIIGLTIITISLLFLSDYKKIIAHWSVVHTGIGLLLLWHSDLLFIGVLYFCNLGHILSSGLMFIIIGYMYDNYGLRVFLLLVSFFGVSIWSSLFLMLFVFNIDFPFMLLFFIDIFVLYGLVNLSLVYLLNFSCIVIIMFISTIYIYISLSYFSFIWIDKYIRVDLTINDIFFYLIIAWIVFCLGFIIIILF